MAMYLSIAIAHLLSMKSVAPSKVRGVAKALKRPPKTVYIAPLFINSFVAATQLQIRLSEQ